MNRRAASAPAGMAIATLFRHRQGATKPRRSAVIQIVPALRGAMTAVCLVLALLVQLSSAAGAVELRVFASVALASVLDELTPTFERTTGHKLANTYGLAAALRKRIADGEAADVIILTRPMMDDLQSQNKLSPSGILTVGGTAVSVAAREGAAKPDISSADALKSALLSAKSIAYGDPAMGGVSSVHFAGVLNRLGIAEQVKPKTTLLRDVVAGEAIAKGEAELAVGQASEIVPFKGAQLVGPLPGEFASVTVFAAGIGIGTKSLDAANAFAQFLTGGVAASVLKKKGFEPSGL
jgi:molybdate transport system substrate-binding protein